MRLTKGIPHPQDFDAILLALTNSEIKTGNTSGQEPVGIESAMLHQW